ncbi:hypothetical protein [Arthrobacter yangruifuii]|uniref:Uncharacterized protein n=1 Tax=Arthrobacter yangruifuii TaxID=2606616 RepID=A0A5N6MHF0_9MICC|nr:hypothetical protein [Arthrobacter yangruifuii]KAD3633154.1 hypothetical protein GD627_10035 [Arthrobacter yangruifuii]
MTERKIMSKSQPVRYWVFRNVVSTLQLLVVAALLGAVALWLLSDNNGKDLWSGYLEFSRGVSNWAKGLRLPWE